jgi:hypothetical protein
MRTVVKGLLLSCVLATLTGCGVTGRWTMQSVKPESAKEHFNLQTLCLMDDGSYMACAQEKGQNKCLKGTYTYDAKTKLLAFKTDGKERSYHAEVGCPGQMKITPTEKGEEWTAIMKHAGACPKDKCCAGGQPCDMKQCPAAKGAPTEKGEKGEKAEKAEKKPAEKKPVEKKPAEKKPVETKGETK